MGALHTRHTADVHRILTPELRLLMPYIDSYFVHMAMLQSASILASTYEQQTR